MGTPGVERSEVGRHLRDLRRIAGLTQRDVATRTGIRQPHIAAYETGKRTMSEAQRQRIIAALRVRPAVALHAHAAEVRAIARRYGATRTRVFGSVARQEDRPDSDLDLLMAFRPGVTLFHVADMKEQIENLLGVPVDIVSEGGLLERDDAIRREAIPL